MDVVDETWYKNLKDPDTFYTNVTSLKLLDHLTKFCLGLHTLNAVDIPQVMKNFFSDAEVIPQFISAIEAAQCESKRAKLVINGEYLHAVALKPLLQSGEYETETRGWSKLPEDKKTWSEWKTTFRVAYVAKRQAEAAREGEEKPFGGSALFGVAPAKTQEKTKTEGTPQLTNQMLNSIKEYLDNIAAAATQTAENEALWRSWPLVWRYQLILSPDSSLRSSDCRSR